MRKNNITKEEARDFALKVKKETGKFPLVTDWVVKNKYPCSRDKIVKLFEGYNNFRSYCEEKHLIRTQELTIEWIKSQSSIDKNQCWNWGKVLREDGYGLLGVKNVTCYVHRVSYEIYYKTKISENLLVRHKCDNRQCCNPEHLELGTQADNTNDMIKRNSDYIPRNNNDLANAVKQHTTLQNRIYFYLKNTYKNDNNCYVSSNLKKHHSGYYFVRYKGKKYSLHRLVLANKLSKDYNELNIARHICNNKSCINPDHLIEGTRSDNGLDSRNNKGVKLTKEEVIEIKKSLLTYEFKVRGDKSKFDNFWSEKLGVSSSAIRNIRLGIRWGDVNV